VPSLPTLRTTGQVEPAAIRSRHHLVAVLVATRRPPAGITAGDETDPGPDSPWQPHMRRAPRRRTESSLCYTERPARK
jgi:hypothetical protein